MPNFPDNHNKQRRENLTIQVESVQLDHMVPQDTLKRFASTLDDFKQFTENGNTKWINCREKVSELKAALALLDEQDQPLGSEGFFINIPQNIVPGYKNQVQGAGNTFDPQVVMNANTCSETAFSQQQRQMYGIMMELANMVDKTLFPNGANCTKAKHYNEEVDNYLAGKLNTLTGLFTELRQRPEPPFADNVWYDRPANKHVKRRPAIWRDATQAPALAQAAPQARQNWNLPAFQITVHALGKDGDAVTLIQVDVDVTTSIPASTWEHIYKRHDLNNFHGDVQAVNTFWQNDPHGFLTGAAGQALLQEELTYLLKESFNFAKPLENLDDGDYQSENWSNSAVKLFFQGEAECSLTNKGTDRIEYSVEVALSSVAPQDQTLAYAFLPQDLPQQVIAPLNQGFNVLQAN